MIYKTFRHVLLGIAVLAPMGLAAQEFSSELQLSNDETTYWYRICNATPGMDGYAMTDGTSQIINFNGILLTQVETEDQTAQWKLTAGEDGKVVITNRATGKQISNTSVCETLDLGYFNITLLTDEGAQGFTVSTLGDYVFSLQGMENDGVNRCLAMADKDGDPVTYPETDASASAIGWKFFPVEIEDAIGSTSASRSSIKIMNKRIVVTGCTDWQLFNAAGEELPRTVSLPTGVYMVKTPKRTVKILVP